VDCQGCDRGAREVGSWESMYDLPGVGGILQDLSPQVGLVDCTVTDEKSRLLNVVSQRGSLWRLLWRLRGRFAGRRTGAGPEV